MGNSNKKVLIVEDDRDVSRVYEIKLAQLGVETILTTDGEEGFEKISSEKPDLVMLDLMLPKKDGFWVLEEMKKDPELSKIPVIALSNLGQDQDRERVFELGAKEYLIKPNTSIADIMEKIKQFI